MKTFLSLSINAEDAKELKGRRAKKNPPSSDNKHNLVQFPTHL